MIYLVGSDLNFKDIKTLVLNEIVYFKFDINLSDFNALILTSKNSINALEFNNILPKSIQIYSIGKATSKRALSYGFCEVYTAKNSHGDEFAKEIAPLLKDKKVLFLRAKNTASSIFEILLENEISVTEVIAYKNVYKPSNDDKPDDGSVIIFTSPSAVNNFISNYGWNDSYKVVAIGKTTANLLKFTKNLKIAKKQTIDECIRVAKTLF